MYTKTAMAVVLLAAVSTASGCVRVEEKTPAWKTVRIGTASSGTELIRRLEDRNVRVSRWSRQVMGSRNFPVSRTRRDVPLYYIANDGSFDTSSYANILAYGAERGYSPPPAETAAHLRLAYTDQPNDHAVVVASRSIPNPHDDHGYALSVERSDAGTDWIVGYRLTAYNPDVRRRLFNEVNGFVFARPGESTVAGIMSLSDMSEVHLMAFPGDAEIPAIIGRHGSSPIVLGMMRKENMYNFSAGVTEDTLPMVEQSPDIPVSAFLTTTRDRWDGENISGFGLHWETGNMFVATAFSIRDEFFGLRRGWGTSQVLDVSAGMRNFFIRFSEHQATNESNAYIREARGRAVGLTAQKQFALYPAVTLTLQGTADRFIGGMGFTRYGAGIPISKSEWDIGTAARIRVTF